MQAASGSWKRQGKILPQSPRENTASHSPRIFRFLIYVVLSHQLCSKKLLKTAIGNEYIP